MAFLRYLLVCVNILLIFVSVTTTITLDISCTDTAQCGGPETACRNGICRCDTPWYTPCGTTQCPLHVAFVYDGEECRNDANCLNNSVCDSRFCRCSPGFTALNGLCYKSLNTTCSASSDCWSNECRDGLCICPSGFVPRGDGHRCQRKLAEIHENLASANQTNDFCYSESLSDGCRDPHAICEKHDFSHRESFCRCPPAYTADYIKGECRLRVYPGALSPSMTPLPYEECGQCNDENALCVRVDNQTTCWCRAGFIKINDKCEKSRRDILFPAVSDTRQHQYTLANCSTNGLCTCASHYEYVDKTSSCRPITPKWDNDVFEYGVCSRIDSHGFHVRENGLCPATLSCQPRQDKFVCACDQRNMYSDETNNTCYYFLERVLTSPVSGRCPPNADLNDTRCLCSPYDIYKPSTDNRRCELNLIERDGDGTCTSNNGAYNERCINLYGGHARFCLRGECRCLSSLSYYNNNTCVALLGINPGRGDYCPPNAENRLGSCQCKTGYRAMNNQNRTCERKVTQLFDSTNAPTQASVTDVTIRDCQVLFPDTPLEARNNACVCINGTFLNNFTCVFYLEYQFPSAEIDPNCPAMADGDTGMCKCKPGYKNDGTNRTCIPLTTRVRPYDDGTNETIIGITNDSCLNLFGRASEATRINGSCRCIHTDRAFWQDNNCYFLVETDQTLITPASACAPGSVAGNKICKCPFGYRANADKRGCIRKAVYSQALQAIDTNNFTMLCNAPDNDTDCEALHGIGAVCRNTTCYCDRSRSYVRNNRCELFSKYIFPGAHERSAMTCNTDEDCSSDPEKNGIECDFMLGYENNYKVCKCKEGYLLNPDDSTCVKDRCQQQCPENTECIGYQCVCKAGYYHNTQGQCVRIDVSLNLHDKCNSTFWNVIANNHEDLYCAPDCGRARCALNYRDDGSRCVRSSFDDRCVHNKNICTQFNLNSQCSKDENRCLCPPNYYRSEGEIICAGAVNSRCANDIDCGDFGQCLNRQCRCKPGRHEQQVSDSLGRTITRCINGIDQIRFSPLLFLFVVLVRLIFA